MKRRPIARVYEGGRGRPSRLRFGPGPGKRRGLKVPKQIRHLDLAANDRPPSRTRRGSEGG